VVEEPKLLFKFLNEKGVGISHYVRVDQILKGVYFDLAF
jgi:hypothetical protein